MLWCDLTRLALTSIIFTMSRLISKAAQKISERLTWCTAHKDQAGIAKDLAAGKEIPEVYGLGEASLFDEFFSFLEQLKISDALKELDPDNAERKSSIEFHTVMLIYMMRIVSGLSFFWHIGAVLLKCQSLMRIVGFNGRAIREGTCKRGVKKSSEEEQKDKNSSNKIRGPVCPEFIAGFIQSISASALESVFNAVIRILAANSFFPKRVKAVFDASDIESTEKCEGRGSVSKEKPPALRSRKKRIRKVMETIFGFKIWVVWDPNSKLPIALRFRTIETADIKMAQEIIQQAIDNLNGHSVIASLAFDRGFIDGKFMIWLDKNDITFYVPAKSNMSVYKDALSLTDEGIPEVKETKKSVGAGKNKKTVTDRTKVVGIEGLTSAGFYGEDGSGSHENKKDFEPNPINAVVVIEDQFTRNNPNSDTMVILTNGPVNKPLKVYNAYDARSEIENSVFREAKQGWFIQRPPRNTDKAFMAHTYLTILVMSLTTAFRIWMDDQDKLDAAGKETGIRKFREKVRQENGNKLIVFDEDRFAIFEAYELFILCGRNVLKPRGIEESISKEDILFKYGAILV